MKVEAAVICIISLTWCGGLTASQPEGSELKQFWSTFRKAALRSDWRKLEDLTSFPLIVRGELDRDPVIRVGRSQFPKVFQRFLKEGVFSPNEQLEIIRSTTTPETAMSSDVTCRIGDMILEKLIRDGDCTHFICNPVWTGVLCCA